LFKGPSAFYWWSVQVYLKLLEAPKLSLFVIANTFTQVMDLEKFQLKSAVACFPMFLVHCQLLNISFIIG